MANTRYTTDGKLGIALGESDAPVTTETGTLIYPHARGDWVKIVSGAGERGFAVYAVAAAAITGSSPVVLGASATASATASAGLISLASLTAPANYGFWVRTSGTPAFGVVASV